MTYYFIDNLRLQLFFATPNICAAFLLLPLFVLLGGGIYCLKKQNKPCRIIAIIAFSGVIIMEILLAMTYSRGGFIALGAGMFMIWVFDRKNKWPLIFAGTFLLCLLAIPNGLDRVESIANTSDGSIYNRFMIWQGGLCILADYWPTGTGFGTLGKIYTAWYQPLWLNERYITLVNDWLTIGAAYGLPVLFIYLFLVFAIVWITLTAWRQTRNAFLLCAGAGVVSYQIASCFSTLYRYWVASVALSAVLLGIVIAVAVQCHMKRLKLSPKDIGIPCVGVIVLCLGLLLSGLVMKQNIPYKFSPIYLSATQAWQAVSKENQQAFVCYFHDSENIQDRELARNTIRMLLAQNYQVLSVDVDSGFGGLDNALTLLESIEEKNKNNLPVFLLGTDNGGKHAIIAAARKNSLRFAGVIAVNSPAEWPFDDLSPMLCINNVTSPLLLVSSCKNGDIMEGLSKLKNHGDNTKTAIHLESLSAETDHEIIKYQEMIQTVDSFIKMILSEKQDNEEV